MTVQHGAAGRVRRALQRHVARSESGVVFVIFAVALIVLMGFVALGIDGSRLFDERRKAQNAADHAAIAASFASCTGADAAGSQAAGLASAATNGYNNDGVTNDVVITAIGVAGTHEFEARVDTTIPATFGAVIGFATMDTGAEALAMATGCGGAAGPGAIYAGGDNCTNSGSPGVDVPGSNNRVYGGVHSNRDVKVGGGSNRFTEAGLPDDPFTYVGAIASGSTGNGNVYQTGYPQDVGPSLPSPQWPDGWAPSEVNSTLLTAYRNLAIANGTNYTNKVSSITKDGVYYTSSNDGMDIGSVTGSLRNVVLVAPNGPIKISASSVVFNPYVHPDLPRDGVLMISNKVYSGTEKCDKYTIAVSGSSSTWNGIMWAPGGLIEMSGSSNTAVKGTLMGWAVRLNGSDLVIRYDADLFPDMDVLLMQ